MNEDQQELTPRTPQEVAQRVLALLAVIGKVHHPDNVMSWIDANRIRDYLSPKELRFVDDPLPSKEDLGSFSWRAEALVSLIWALKGLDEMPNLYEEFRVFENEMVLTAAQNPDLFISKASLRDKDEISSMEEFLYHQHWRVRDAESFNIGNHLESSPDDPPIEELNHGIVYERRYGLSWLAGGGGGLG
jgi:hypothetical protein